MQTTRRAFTDPVFQRLAATMLVVIAIAFRAIQIVAASGSWPWAFDFSAYWLAGRHILDGQSIYAAAQLAGPYAPQLQYLYLYPPPLATIVAPLAGISPDSPNPAYIVWVATGALFAGAVLVAIVRDGHLGDRFPVLAGFGALLFVGAAAALPPVIGEVINGNVHLWLLGLLGLGWLGIRRESPKGDAIAGIAVGIGALIKLFPAFLILWFALTGRWRAAGWSIVGAAVVTVVTLPATGLQPWLQFPSVLLNMTGPNDATFSIAPTTWLSDAFGFTPARLLVTAAGLVTIAWAAHLSDSRRGYALAVLAALLMTPILWSHYLTVAVLPLLLGLAAGLPLALVGLVYLLLSTGNQSALGGTGFVFARAAPLLGLLMLAVALGRPSTLSRRRSPTGDPAPA
jgi:alpha-1,2-mannosyltransferase